MADFLRWTLAVIDPHPGLAFFVELTVKSTTLLLFTLLLGLILRRAAVARQHLVWSLGILTLSALPVFLAILPEIQVLLPATSTTASTAPPANLHARITSSWNWLLQLYLSGLAALLLYTFAGLGRMVLLSVRARPCTNPRARALLRDLLAEELADTDVSLREHPALGSPLSWGLMQPVVILPEDNDTWSTEKLRHVLLHELGHIQRLDWITQLAGHYVCALYWYNPLVWLAARRMNELAEQACDDSVLLQSASHTAYASDLLGVARGVQSANRPGYLAQAMAASFLGSRVKAILDTARLRKRNDSVWVIRGVLAAFTFTALLASIKPALALAPLDENSGSRFLRVRFLPREAPVREPERMAVHQMPEHMEVSSNFPELETILVQNPPLGPPPLPTDTLAQIRVTLEEVAGPATQSDAVLLKKGFPEYPRTAWRRGTEGGVTLEYEIDVAGRVRNPRIIESSPRGVFESSALQAIGEYRYQPATVNGLPVPVKGLRTRFNFRIDSG